MSFKTKIKLLILLTVCMAACLIAGCKVGGVTKDEFLNRFGVGGQYVTYYANGGNFNNQNSRQQMDIYYAPNSYIICSNQTNFVVGRKFFNFDGWYYIEADSEGNPALDEDGNYVFGDMVSSEDRVEGGKHILVAAKWTAIVAIEIYLVSDDGASVRATDGTVYNSGDLLDTKNFGSSDTVFALTQRQAITATDATYLYFFEDEACTKPISSVTMPVPDEDEGEDGEDEDTSSGEEEVENIKVYVKYLRGNWNVVSTASNVVSMFNNASVSQNYYLFSTDGSGVIDCSALTGKDGAAFNTGSFNINLQGNGVTIRGLSVSPFDSNGNPLTIINSSVTYTAFGRLSATSQIKDVIFDDLRVTATASGIRPLYINLYMFCLGAEQGAKIEGLVLNGATFAVTTTGNVAIENFSNNNNWIFGSGSDSDFMQNYGITVTGASLTLNGNAVVKNISKNRRR